MDNYYQKNKSNPEWHEKEKARLRKIYYEHREQRIAHDVQYHKDHPEASRRASKKYQEKIKALKAGI